MTGEEIIEAMRSRLDKDLLEASSPFPSRLYLTVKPERLPDAVGLLKAQGARFVISGGTDRQEQTGEFLVSYFFAFDEDDIYLALHVPVPADQPQVPSITPLIPGANWSERECYDLVGVRAEGHPDPRRLILPDDWPEGVHPLRTNIPHGYKPPSHPENAVKLADPPEGASAVPIGPFFPVLEEPAHFRVFVEGEEVVGCDYRGFYNHRGVEKLGCAELTYNQIPFIAERICGICGFTHSTCYCQAVEEAAGIEVPARARFIRTVLLELERIESHLLWLGIAGHIIGFDTLLMQVWRMREPLMWLCEKITGNRKTYGTNLVGGVRWDIAESLHPEIHEVLDKIEQEWRELYGTIPGDSTTLARLQGVGILEPEEARALCAVGPTARGSGLALDVRGDHPYAAYGQLDFQKCVQTSNDILGRTIVRLEETLVAIDLIREALAAMPPGPLQAPLEDPLPAGRQGISAVEAPRGEVFHWVLTGPENRPERWRVRAPTYANLQNVPPMILGETLADVPIGIGSYDPCFSCTERFEVVDVNSGQIRVCYLEELTQKDQEGAPEGEEP